MANPITEPSVETRSAALRVASLIGCSGAHQVDDAWHPCASAEDLKILLDEGKAAYDTHRAKARSKKVREKGGARFITDEVLESEIKKRPKRKKRSRLKPKKWENLRERGVSSIQGGGPGITSGKAVDPTKEKPENLGVVAVLLPSPKTAKPYLQKDGLPLEELHLTLGYYVDSTAMPEGLREDMTQWAYHVAARWSPIVARVNGVAALGDETPQAVVLLVQNARFQEIREDLDQGERAKYMDRKHPGFLPHMTVGYDISQAIKPGEDVVFDRVGIWWAGEKLEIPLIGRSAD